MADPERKLIRVTGRLALQYVDAIEGLIFDPQPYRFPDGAATKPAEQHPRGRLRLPWIQPRQEESTPTHDPIKSRLGGRWTYFTSHQMYTLIEGGTGNEPDYNDREYLYRTMLYKINERSSLLVDAGEPRTYQIDVQLFRDADTRIVFSCLHLHHPQRTAYEAHLLMDSQGAMRIERDGDLTKAYTPSYVEQQRLLAVAELLRKHT